MTKLCAIREVNKSCDKRYFPLSETSFGQQLLDKFIKHFWPMIGAIAWLAMKMIFQNQLCLQSKLEFESERLRD